MENSLKPIAIRITNAENEFYENAMDQFGFTKQESAIILASYIKNKIVKLNMTMGKYQLSHGIFWDKEIMKKALETGV